VRFEFILIISIANICITYAGGLKRIEEVTIEAIETLGGVVLELISLNLLVETSPTFLELLLCERT
jgi:ABC-type phosphate/phosphonate transport system permease subunit